ncbi:hypothetical protein HK405_011297, partial [Cladochytrium tenue]
MGPPPSTTSTTPPQPPKSRIAARVRTFAWFLITAVVFYRYFIVGRPALPALCKVIFGYKCPPLGKITGFVAPGYEALPALFAIGWAEGDEVGASFSAYVGGVRVVELYGGFTDTTYTAPYSPDTLQMVFSSSKAVTSIAVMHLVERGVLDLDRRVADYWPEFATGGKADVTVRDLLRHRAGVPFLDSAHIPTPEDTGDLDRLASLIAPQPHAFDGAPVSAYHATTRGWYINELVRRAHPEGKSLRDIMNEEIIPLLYPPSSSVSGDGATYEFHFGFSDAEYDAQAPRVSRFVRYPFPLMMFRFLVPDVVHSVLGTLPFPGIIKSTYLSPWSLQAKALLGSGPRFENPRDWPNTYNSPAILKGHGPSY